MSNHFKEARQVTQKKYGAYCNKMRSEGLEPLPYHLYQTYVYLGGKQ